MSSYECCKDKDYQDVVTNAFTVLEDRIRAKIGIDPSYSGKKLVDYAFAAKTGKLTLEETVSEQESLYFLFRGAFGFFNPPCHRLIEDESNIESFEIIHMIDLLVRIVTKRSCEVNACMTTLPHYHYCVCHSMYPQRLFKIKKNHKKQ